MKLGVALGWHVHPWQELLGLVRRAEELGYTAAFVDGDLSMLGERSEADALDGWTVTTALLAHTRQIQIGSMRVAHHWNAARLAQAVATAVRLAPGRLRFLVSEAVDEDVRVKRVLHAFRRSRTSSTPPLRRTAANPFASSSRNATKSRAWSIASVSVSTPNARRATSSFRWSMTTFLRTQPDRLLEAR